MVQALRVDFVGRAVRHRRRPVRAAGGHHQPVRNVAGQLHRNGGVGGRGRARHLARPDCGRLHRERLEKLVHGCLAGAVAVRAGPAVHRRHPVLAARHAGRVEQVQAQARRGRGGRMSIRMLPGMASAEAGPTYSRVKGEGVDTTHGAILYLEDISVSFDGFKAINKLSLDISVGELRCIIGPNGAGKTTMMDVITGKTRPTSGTAWFGQTMNLATMTEAQIAHAGIGRKFQRPTVFEQHTVFDNLELAMKMDKRVAPTLFARLTSEQAGKIEAILRLIRLNGHEARPAGLLSHGQKQWLEIGMLLMQEPQLILLDEPVAGMSDAETARTAELLNELRGKHSIMVVEHDMGFVTDIAQQGIVTVLHEGAVLAQGRMDEVQADERVIEVYLGR